jgi:nicotinamide riboside transporter PnuC
LLALGNLSSIFLTGRGKLAGFVVLVPTQLVFAGYAAFTDQLGFVLQGVAMTSMAIIGWYRWVKRGVHRDARQSREKVSTAAE